MNDNYIMADSVSKEQRSWNMSRIHSADTSIEVKARKYVFSKGFRYRKNDAKLPGKPDIVLPKYKTVVFIHGCFWHRHDGCKYAATPGSNSEYWQQKFRRNTENDKDHAQKLNALGWKVITIWECEIKKAFDETMNRVIDDLLSSLP